MKIQEYSYALVYLNQAEKVLEYGASCGKIIDRELIITVLHNQACCYQKMNDLSRAIKYVEAIIFNLKSYVKSLDNTPTASNIAQVDYIQHNNHSLIRKIDLAQHYLVFCSMSSQLGNRKESLNAGKTAIQIYKAYFHELKDILYGSQFHQNQILCLGQDKLLMNEVLKTMKTLRSQHNFQLNQLQSYVNIAKITIKQWKNRLNNQTNQTLLEKLLKSYSIGNLVELRALTQYGNQQRQILFQGTRIIKNIVHLAMAYFQIATEYRLIAESKFMSESKYQSNHSQQQSVQHVKSQIYYLFSIVFIALNVPYDFLFMRQIIQSYQHHFGTNLCKKQKYTPVLDYSLIFQTQQASTVLKVRKKSAGSKRKTSKSNKLLSKEKSQKKFGLKQSKANKNNQINEIEEEYFASRRTSNHGRLTKQRVISSSSRASNQSDKMKYQQRQVVEENNCRVRRIRSTSQDHCLETVLDLKKKKEPLQEESIAIQHKIKLVKDKIHISTKKHKQVSKKKKEKTLHTGKFPSNLIKAEKTRKIRLTSKQSGKQSSKQSSKQPRKSLGSSQKLKPALKKVQNTEQKKERARQRTINNYYL